MKLILHKGTVYRELNRSETLEPGDYCTQIIGGKITKFDPTCWAGVQVGRALLRLADHYVLYLREAEPLIVAMVKARERRK